MKSPVKTSLLIAGGINILFTAFHIAFYYLFNWKETLSCLGHSNWAIFQTFYLGSILMVAMMAYLSLRFPNDLYRTVFGKSLSVAFCLFYFIRIMSEFLLFGYRGIPSMIIIVLCAIPAAIYFWAAASRVTK